MVKTDLFKRTLAGFLSMTLAFFSQTPMPEALAQVSPITSTQTQNDQYVTSDVSQTEDASKPEENAQDPYAQSLDDFPLSTTSNVEPAKTIKAFSAKAATSQEGDSVSVTVAEGGKARVTWAQRWQTQTYEGMFDAASGSIRIENLPGGNSWNLTFETNGDTYALKRFDVIMNQTGYRYEQRHGFDGGRLGFIEYASKSDNAYGSYDSLYHRGFTYNAAGQWMDHSVSVNKSSYALYQNSAAGGYAGGVMAPGSGERVTQYSVWMDTGTLSEDGKAVKTQISIYGTDADVKGLQELYVSVRAAMENGKMDYAGIGSLVESHPASFMKTENHYAKLPSDWNNLLFSVESVKDEEGKFTPRLLRMRSDYQNVRIVLDTKGSGDPASWETVGFKNWQSVPFAGRNYYASYGLSYAAKSSGGTYYNADGAGRMGEPFYGLTLSAWFQDPVTKTWVQDLIQVDDFPKNRRVVMGGQEFLIHLDANGVITLKPAPPAEDPALQALREKVAALISEAGEAAARYRAQAERKDAEAEIIHSEMSPSIARESEIAGRIALFPDIPGMDILKQQSAALHAMAGQEAEAGARYESWLRGDAGLDRTDAAAFEGYIEKLKAAAAMLVPGTDPSQIKLPEAPMPLFRTMGFPSFDLAGSLERLSSLIEKQGHLAAEAEGLMARFDAGLKQAEMFARSFAIDANGMLNLDLNRDGIINDTDASFAKAGYTQAFDFVPYLPADAVQRLDSNRDGAVNVMDAEHVILLITRAMDHEGPVIEGLQYPALTNQKQITVHYLVDGTAVEQIFDLTEGENLLAVTASDDAGNVTRRDFRVVLDTIPPQIALDGVPGAVNNEALTVTYSVDGVPRTQIFKLVAGLNELFIEAKDEAGNVSRSAFKVMLDMIPPVIRVISQIPEITNQGRFVVQYVTDETTASNGSVFTAEFRLVEGMNTLKITATDAVGNEGVYEFRITLDTIAPRITDLKYARLTNEKQVVVSYLADGIEHQMGYALENEGENVFVIRAEDKAGNVTEEKIVVVRDTTAPVIELGDVPDVVKDKMLTLVYSVDGQKQEKTFELAAGMNELFVEAMDEAGNHARMAFKVILDTTAPVIRVITAIPEITNQKHLVVEYFTESGNTEGGMTQKAEFDLVEGMNALKITAADAAGNIGVYEFKITLDTIAPEIKGLEYPRLTNEKQVVVSYLVDGVEQRAVYGLEKEGENVFVISASDKAGNRTEMKIAIVRDTTAPVIELGNVPEITKDKMLTVVYSVDGQKQEKTFELAAGMNELFVEAKDEAGNYARMAFKVILDTTAPVIRVITVIPEVTNQKHLVVEYFVESGNADGGMTQKAEFDLVEGMNKLKITAVDAAGNVGIYEFGVTLDTIAPEIKGLEYPRLTNEKQAVVNYVVDGVEHQMGYALENEGENVFVISASDKAGNLTEVKIMIVRDTTAPVIVLGEVPEVVKDKMLTVVYSVDGQKQEKTFELAAGMNELFVEAKDEAGNHARIAFKVILDTTAPVIRVISTIPEITNQKHLVVEYFVESGNAEGGVTQKSEFDLVEGMNKLKITAVDAAGNVGVYEFGVTLDTIAPEITGLKYPRLTNEKQSVVSYLVDGVEHQMGYALESEGENVFVIRAEDKAGNSTEVKIVIVRDTTAPVISNLNYEALTNQTRALVKYDVDGQSKEREFELAEGENTFRLDAVDDAGNQTSVEVWIVRDTKAPEITDVQFKALTNQKTAEIVYREDGVEKKMTAELAAEGPNEIRVAARDEAGNQTFVDIVITRDTAAPEIQVLTEIPEVTAASFLTVRYSVDGGDAAEKMFQFTEGMNSIFIEIADEAGNVGRSKVYQIEYRPEEAQNRVPVANGASFKGDQDGRLTGFVTGSDEDGDVLRYGIASAPQHGTLELNEETGAFVYVPEAGFSGADSFSFTVKDAEDVSEAAIVAIEIAKPGSAPVFQEIPDQSVFPVWAMTSTVNFQLSAADPEGEVVTFSIKEIQKDGLKTNMPQRMLLTAEGAFSWAPEPADAGLYVITFAAEDAEGLIAERQMSLDVQTPEICSGTSDVCKFLKQKYKEGLAAGNIGDYYHNMDGDHAPYAMQLAPQLSRMGFGWGAHYANYPDRVIIGNSSTSGSIPGSSNPGYLEAAYGAQATYKQYRSNNRYFYPEHRDYDLVDHYLANNPYVFTSQGSSGSEGDEVRKYIYTLAAFRPEVKKLLKEKGLLMPAMEMIFRLTRVGSDEERYRTGEAHPRAFDNSDNLMAMVKMANDMTISDIPAFAQLKVVEDNFVTGPTGYDRATEDHYDTPAAVSRVFRGNEYTKTMVLDAGESFDVNGHPLTFDWRILRGDAEHVRITKLNDSGSRVQIEVDYFGEFSGAGSQIGGSILGNRVDVGLFVNNGHTWSAPAFVSVSTLRNEQRDYDENGVLKEIAYNTNALSTQLGYAKGWLKDTYNADGSWTRTMLDGKTAEFTKEGFQAVSKDALGRVLSSREVTYAYNSSLRKISFTPVAGNLSFYEYENDEDFTGRLAYMELTPSQGVFYRGRFQYSPEGVISGINVESASGQLLSRIIIGLDGVFLVSADGDPIRIPSNRSFREMIQMAGDASAVLHILFKTAEQIAAEGGVSVEELELRSLSVGVSPETAPYEGYLGNMTMLFHNRAESKDHWAYSWTNRLYPVDLYPHYPESSGFHIAIMGTNWNYVFHDFTQAGVFMGTHSPDYENEMRVRNLAGMFFEEKTGKDASRHTFRVTSGAQGSDGTAEGKGSGYSIQVVDEQGTVVNTYIVSLSSYGQSGNMDQTRKTLYTIYGADDSANTWGYILVDGKYVLAMETHDGKVTCYLTAVCG